PPPLGDHCRGGSGDSARPSALRQSVITPRKQLRAACEGAVTSCTYTAARACSGRTIGTTSPPSQLCNAASGWPIGTFVTRIMASDVTSWSQGTWIAPRSVGFGLVVSG